MKFLIHKKLLSIQTIIILLTCFLIITISQRDRFQSKQDEREEMKSYIRDPLNEAVVMGDYYRTTNLLSRDMNLIVSGEYPIIVDKQNEFGRTQLLNCGMDPQSDDIKVNDISCKKIAKLLKKHGAKMNHVDKSGWDALSLGAVKGYTEFCRYLLKSNLKVDRIDREGKTAAMKAASLGFYETLHMLVNEGKANISIADKKGMTTLHHVTQLSISNSSYIPFLSSTIKLINNASLHVDSFLDFDNRTPLMYSVLGNCLLCAKELINATSDPRLFDKYGVTPIQMSKSTAMTVLLTDSIVTLVENEHKLWLKKQKTKKVKSEL